MTGRGPSCGWLFQTDVFSMFTFQNLWGRCSPILIILIVAYFSIGCWAKVNDDVVLMLILKTNKKQSRPDLSGDPPDWIACSPNKVCNFVRISFGLKYVQLDFYPLIFQIPSGQFITTFLAGWSPQLVVRSKGIPPNMAEKIRLRSCFINCPDTLWRGVISDLPKLAPPEARDHPRAWLHDCRMLVVTRVSFC